MLHPIPARKRIALVAHDAKKPDLLAWATEHVAELRLHELFATGTTGKVIGDGLGLPITRLLSGPLGGDQQLGALIAELKIDLLIFFWDPLTAQPHDPDVKAVIRLATMWNIPVACNRATADFLFLSPWMAREYQRQIPDAHGRVAS
jgi:methylglyoxal synthase